MELGVSMRDLEKRSGVSRGVLSLIESSRMVPTGDEFDRVMGALEAFGEETASAAGVVHDAGGTAVASHSSPGSA